MPALAVRLLGQFSVSTGDGATVAFEGRKVQELFAYLLLERDRRHAREAIAGLFWTDSRTDQARKYLRQALWQVQTALTAAPEAATRLLSVEPDWISLGSGPDLWLDVAALERAHLRAKGIAGPNLPDALCRELREAAELYRGNLLEECYEDWCLIQRERLQNLYLAILDKLMLHAERHGEFEVGLAYGEQILHHDRASERTHRQLMRLHYLAGDRTAAIRQFERCVEALAEELDVRPARVTVALCEQIRSDRGLDHELPDPVARAVPPPTLRSQPALASPSELRRTLEQLREAVAELEAQAQRSLQAIHQALRGQE
jgi:DNA-binding SARP family transcriptional activator